MALGDQSSRPPTKGAAHYRHAKAAQQRGDDVTDVRVKRRNLLAAYRAKMAAKRGTRAVLQDEPTPAEGDEPG
ncbi:MAG TPA: hypothetical protein VI542_34880 [Candidatus Tectomicrobia bacterium]